MLAEVNRPEAPGTQLTHNFVLGVVAGDIEVLALRYKQLSAVLEVGQVLLEQLQTLLIEKSDIFNIAAPQFEGFFDPGGDYPLAADLRVAKREAGVDSGVFIELYKKLGGKLLLPTLILEAPPPEAPLPKKSSQSPNMSSVIITAKHYE